MRQNSLDPTDPAGGPFLPIEHPPDAKPFVPVSASLAPLASSIVYERIIPRPVDEAQAAEAAQWTLPIGDIALDFKVMGITSASVPRVPTPPPAPAPPILASGPPPPPPEMPVPLSAIPSSMFSNAPTPPADLDVPSSAGSASTGKKRSGRSRPKHTATADFGPAPAEIFLPASPDPHVQPFPASSSFSPRTMEA